MSARTHEVFVQGIGFWATRLPGWNVARDVLRGVAQPPASATTRPAPSLLPPAERRRAPDTVAVALEVAARACESARCDPKTLPCVFASANGDLPVSDAICDTLAKTPVLTSPTKFHNSVHNAAAGYWTIATGCMKPYTALCARHFTFAQALLESAAQALSEQTPVLLVAYDIASRGPVATMQPSTGVFAGALVLSPHGRDTHVARLVLDVREHAKPTASVARPENAALVEGNAMANALPLFEALADEADREIAQPLAPGLCLGVRIDRATAPDALARSMP